MRIALLAMIVLSEAYRQRKYEELTIAKEINHPIMGRERLSAHDLEGFSFLIPNKYTPHFRIGEKEVPCTCFSKGTTESVFGLPINRLPFPDA